MTVNPKSDMDRALAVEFGAKLRAIREASGDTLQEIATRLGVTRQSVGLVERGERCPPIYQLPRWCDAYGADLLEVFPEG